MLARTQQKASSHSTPVLGLFKPGGYRTPLRSSPDTGKCWAHRDFSGELKEPTEIVREAAKLRELLSDLGADGLGL